MSDGVFVVRQQATLCMAGGYVAASMDFQALK